MSRLQRGLSGITAGLSGLGGHLGQGKSFDELKQLIHGRLVDKLDLSKVSELAGDTLRRRAAQRPVRLQPDRPQPGRHEEARPY